MTTSRTANADTRRATQSRKTPVTKKAQLIRMLKSWTGTDVEAVSRKLGWQSHTTRAALAGLRKAGYEITSEKPESGRPTRYRITSEPTLDGSERAGVSADAG